jgi:hypothetical protein
MMVPAIPARINLWTHLLKKEEAMRIKLFAVALILVLLSAVAVAQDKIVSGKAVPGKVVPGKVVSSKAIPGKIALKPSCDRACLEGYVDRYLDAMQAHNMDPELFAKNVVFTENGVRFPFRQEETVKFTVDGKMLPYKGEGLWYSMVGKGTYKFYVPDIETQQIAFIGTVKEGGSRGGNPTTIALALRLKIVNKLITEIEQLAIRPEQTLGGGGAGGAGGGGRGGGAGGGGTTGDSVEKMGAPNERFFKVIPEAERASRENLIKAADHYFSDLQRWDGKGVYNFTDDCVRFENGMTATSNAKQQFTSGQGIKGVVSRIRDRRWVAVDRERGIAFAFGFFDHIQLNWTWQIAELFRIEKGNIARIEAVFQKCPYGLNSGWSTFEQGMSEKYRSIK